MAGFSFGNINVSSKKRILNVETINHIVLVDKSDDTTYKNDFPVNVLLDEYYSQEQLNNICRFFRSQKLYKYKIIYVLNCLINKEDIKNDQKEGIINFYILNKSNFESELIEGAPIITVGPALYALTQENDIQPNHFQQRLFSKTHFWFSKDLTRKSCHLIFPIESFNDIFADGFVDKNNKPIKEVDSFKTKLAYLQIASCLKLGKTPRPDYHELNKVFIESEEDFDKLFYEPNKDKINELLAWDIETSGLSFIKDSVGCISISFDGETGYYIPWKYVNKRKLNYILSRNRQCGANLKYDEKFLWKESISSAWTDEDVIVLGHILDETRSNSLKSLAFYFSEYGGYERPLDIYKKKTNVKNYLTIPEHILRDYAIMDAIVTWRVWDNMMKHIKEIEKKYPNEFYSDNILNYYYDRCIPASNMYARIEYRGFYINKDKLDNLRKTMEQYVTDTKNQLSKLFNVKSTFNWDSNQQLGKLLEEKGWEDLGRVSTGEYQVSDFQLKRWDKTHHEEVKLIQDLKHAQTLFNGFVGDSKSSASSLSLDLIDNDEEGSKGWPQYLTYHQEDDSWRMHANYFSMGTDSGRTRCKAPNLQNIPTRGMFASDIKKCVCTPDDDNFYRVTIDYSSLQMRLAAIDTDPVTTKESSDGKSYPIDENLYKAFWTPHIDMHSKTAFLSFCSEKEFDVETIKVEQDGQTFTFLGGEVVITKNRGEILARELKETDELKIG